MKRSFAVLVAATGLVLAGCSAPPPPGVNDVAPTASAIATADGATTSGEISTSDAISTSEAASSTGIASTAITEPDPSATSTAAAAFTPSVGSAAAEPGTPSSLAQADVELPKLVTDHYLDLSQIARISRFRSGAGHDFSDGFEACRSMKHYFWPKGGEPGQTHAPAWTTLRIVAPFDGTLVRIMPEELAGQQLWIRSDAAPEFTVRIFHVTPGKGIEPGAKLRAGQVIGHHASDQTTSDIAVEHAIMPGRNRLVSYIDLLSDDRLADLAALDVSDPVRLVMSTAERDRQPLHCEGERFTEPSTDADWVDLRP